MDDRNAEAFRAMYRAHYRAVCRYLAARTDRDLVEDLAADTFLVAWRRQAQLPDHIVPWLLNTAGKCLANQRRSRKRAAALVERLGGVAAIGTAVIDEDLARREQLRALLAALATLGERDRELLLLTYWDGLAARDAAAVLELNPVLVRTRLYRASRRLRETLARELERENRRPRANELEAVEPRVRAGELEGVERRPPANELKRVDPRPHASRLTESFDLNDT
jgi:RNA polymerase sigma-70 factor, ECF subfamily